MDKKELVIASLKTSIELEIAEEEKEVEILLSEFIRLDCSNFPAIANIIGEKIKCRKWALVGNKPLIKKFK
jgi:hypothetical protein